MVKSPNHEHHIKESTSLRFRCRAWVKIAYHPRAYPCNTRGRNIAHKEPASERGLPVDGGGRSAYRRGRQPEFVDGRRAGNGMDRKWRGKGHPSSRRRRKRWEFRDAPLFPFSDCGNVRGRFGLHGRQFNQEKTCSARNRRSEPAFGKGIVRDEAGGERLPDGHTRADKIRDGEDGRRNLKPVRIGADDSGNASRGRNQAVALQPEGNAVFDDDAEMARSASNARYPTTSRKSK